MSPPCPRPSSTRRSTATFAAYSGSPASLRYASAGAALQPVALHDRRVQFDHAVAGEDRAAPGVEARIVLEHAHRGLDGVEGGAARREDSPTRESGGTHAPAKLVAPLARVRAGAAVEDDRGYARRGGAVGRWRPAIHRVKIPATCKT